MTRISVWRSDGGKELHSDDLRQMQASESAGLLHNAQWPKQVSRCSQCFQLPFGAGELTRSFGRDMVTEVNLEETSSSRAWLAAVPQFQFTSVDCPFTETVNFAF